MASGRDLGWSLAFALAGAGALLSVSSMGCARDGGACADDAVVGTVGRDGAPIDRREVEALVARTRMAGGTMEEHRALIDLLWQESERQRLGLPGGAQAAQSRREVVRGHQGRLRSGEQKPLRNEPDQLPPGAALTPCGRRILERARGG